MDETVRNIIIECRQSIRSAAFEFDLCHQTLNRHVQNAMKGSQVNVGSTGIGTITIYLESFRMYFGLNPMIIKNCHTNALRQLILIGMPDSCRSVKSAG